MAEGELAVDEHVIVGGDVVVVPPSQVPEDSVETRDQV